MSYEISGNTSVAEVVTQYPQTRRLLEEMQTFQSSASVV